jgi:hypothetical protein
MKQRHKEQKLPVGVLYPGLAPVNIDSIAKGLKRIKADTDRKSEFRNLHVHSGQDIYRIRGHGGIFKSGKNTQVYYDRTYEGGFCLPPITETVYNSPVKIIGRSTYNEENYPYRFTPGIEDKGGKNQYTVLPASRRYHIIEEKCQRKEKI